MLKLILIATACFIAHHVQVCHSVTADDIAKYAKKQIGSIKWTKDSEHFLGAGKWKCNIFVADVLKHVHADAPNRWPWYSPIGANQWADPKSGYLKYNRKWQLCKGNPRKGDVIARGGHVGIVTGHKQTTSANARAKPKGKIEQNSWGFRTWEDRYRKPTCWRYDYDGTYKWWINDMRIPKAI